MAKVTMQDIANELGISKCMVSLALSDRYGVNSDTKAKIITEAVRMGYDFSKIRRKASTKVHIVVLIREEDLDSRRYWPQVFRGVVKRAKELDYTLGIEVISENMDYGQFFIRLAEHCSSGIVVLNYISDEFLFRLGKLKLPIVLVDSKNIAGTLFDQIRVNNEAGSYEATRLLLEKGHRNICFIGNKNYSVSFKERYRGFIEATKAFRDEINAHSIDSYYGPQNFVEKLAEVGVRAEEAWKQEYLFDIDEVCRLLRRNGKGVTALICANDVAADIVYRLCLVFGIRIPEDISIVGFDNLYSNGNDWINRELTSVAVPIREMGERAVNLLQERIQNGNGICETILLAVRVVEKNTIKEI